MNASPLQLERYFFTKIQLDAHATPTPKVANNLVCEVELAEATDDSRRYQLQLRLKLDAMPNEQPPYTGEFHAVGLFRVVDGWPQDKCAQLVEANGGALLFGAIREMVANMTARGPWQSITLRTVTFARPPGGKKMGARKSPRKAVKPVEK